MKREQVKFMHHGLEHKNYLKTTIELRKNATGISYLYTTTC